MLLTYLLAPTLGFGDTFTSFWGHPYALARTALRQELESFHLHLITGSILDVGCGSMPYKKLFSNASSYHGLEIDQPRNKANSHVSYWYDGHTFPLADHSYDVVVCSQVLEHSFNPKELLSEIYRVLRPGGQLFLTIPFFWPEHEQPYDSQRFTVFGLKTRLETIGFGTIETRKTNPGLSALIQLTIEWIESLQRRCLRGRLALILRVFLIIPYSLLNLIGAGYRSCCSHNRDHAPVELYLDLIVRAVKP